MPKDANVFYVEMRPPADHKQDFDDPYEAADGSIVKRRRPFLRTMTIGAESEADAKYVADTSARDISKQDGGPVYVITHINAGDAKAGKEEKPA